MSDLPIISFVLITYKRGALLQQTVESILSQERIPPYEIILIDNGGDAKIHYPASHEVSITRPSQNLGVAAGRNLGMSLARGKYLVLLDDDAEWRTSTDVFHIIEHFEQDASCGAVAAKSLSPAGAPIMLELPHPNKDYILSKDTPVRVPYFYGVAHALRAGVLQVTGNYPDRYFYGMEEVDLALRVYDAGYYILFDPNVCVYHHHSNLGRPVIGSRYWHDAALNKSRVAWRLLPFPYPISVSLIWTLLILWKTGSIRNTLDVWIQLWRERKRLLDERRPIRAETVHRLKDIGARLLY